MIHSEIRNSVLCLKFEDPASRNSFSLKAAQALREALNRDASRAEALLFEAPGRVFCSGGNLSDYAGMTTAEQGKEVNREITAVLEQLSQLRLPTVALVTGDCFGGGLELLSAFDYAIAVPHAVFAFWQRRIGLSYGWGGGARLERRLGRSHLIRLTLTTESLNAREALSLGLVDELAPMETIAERGFERALSLKNLPKAPVAKLKSFNSEKEQSVFEELWWNPEHRKVLETKRKS